MYPAPLRALIKERLRYAPIKEFEEATGIRKINAQNTANGVYRCSLEDLFTIMEYLELDTWDNKYKPERPWVKPRLNLRANPSRHKKPWHMRAIAQL